MVFCHLERTSGFLWEYVKHLGSIEILLVFHTLSQESVCMGACMCVRGKCVGGGECAGGWGVCRRLLQMLYVATIGFD